MSKNAALLERRSHAIGAGVGLMTPVFAEKALNAQVWDADGKEYIDFASGIAVTNTGHCNPRIVSAIQAQLSNFTHTCHHVMAYEPYVRLAERLNDKTPGDFEKKTVFVTTGAEAVENAVKLARAATGRSSVISFSGSFHGRTFMAMSLTGKVAPYKQNFGVMMPDVHHLPFPIDVHGVSIQDSLDAMDRLFASTVEHSQVAAIIIEPIQGEGGFYEAPAALIKHIRHVCDKHGIIFIVDEIQTGFARTGCLFAMEHFDVAPDITVMAKGLAGGMPLAALTGRAEIMDAAQTGGIGGTYGGNPLAIAAANAVLDIIDEDDLCGRANELGSRLKQRLEAIRQETPELIDIRGKGFMIAAEFNTKDGARPNPEFVTRLKAEALSRGLLLLSCGVYGNVVRFLAPLTIEAELLEEALNILEASIKSVKDT